MPDYRSLGGDALEPDFKDGDLLTVAPDVLALPGDCVVALVGSAYRCLRINADSDLWDGKGGFVPRGFYTLVDCMQVSRASKANVCLVCF